MNKVLILMALTVLSLGFASSLSVESVTVDTVSPGGEGIIRIDVENDGNQDIELLSVKLDFANPNIIPIGSSEEFLNSLEEDEEESFVFRFRVSNTLPVGTYSVDYSIIYEEGNEEIEQSGTIGIVVSAEPEIEIAANVQNAIIGEQAKLDVRVINKGLADARFVYLTVESDDITILSENSEYIGTIDSDDFETSSFDVIYNTKFPAIFFKLTYKDFDNIEQEITDTASLRAYTKQEAVEKGILKKNNATIYVGIAILLLVVWFIYRRVRRSRKKE
ncbi:MAG: hypothetical protein AABW71_01505 [Nanoarchaeota archaeon]